MNFRICSLLLACCVFPCACVTAIAQETNDGQEKEVAEIAHDEAALRADVEKNFKKKVGAFVNKYCINCHGPRPEAGINLRSALNTPGTASSALHWKKSVANVRVHDMPPDHANKIPTEDERDEFIEWIGKLGHRVSGISQIISQRDAQDVLIFDDEYLQLWHITRGFLRCAA